MKVLVTGITGNLGTALLRRLVRDGHDVRGIARRVPSAGYDHADIAAVDLEKPDAAERLARHAEGVDAIVHLAWEIQPSRDREHLRRVNVGGTEAVVEAARLAGIGHLVHMSSVGAYAPVARGALRRVDETWPTTGIETSRYSVDKAAAERVVKEVHDLRVAVVRPSLVLQPQAATEIGRYFLGPLVPTRLVTPLTMRLLPWPSAVRLQFVHADDVADAVVRILDRGAVGAYNVAADPVVDRARVGELFRPLVPPAPYRLARSVADATWRTHLQPTGAGWLDLASSAPLLSTDRARRDLGWLPNVAGDALLQRFVRATGRAEEGAGPLLGSPQAVRAVDGHPT